MGFVTIYWLVTKQTCVLRAWDLNKLVLFCPAMNTLMWEHPFTAKQIDILTKELNFVQVEPIVKKLACGDYGNLVKRKRCIREPGENCRTAFK